MTSPVTSPVTAAAEVSAVLAGLVAAGVPYRVAGGWGVDVLAGRVPCLSAALQDRLHRGYPPRPVDTADLEVLRGVLGTASRGSG